LVATTRRTGPQPSTFRNRRFAAVIGKDNAFTTRRAGAPSITIRLMSDFVLQDGAADRRRFEELLANRFPEIAGQINEVERGLLHLEMAAFARATCAVIDRGEFHVVAVHLAFIDELFRDAAPDLENAIYVSYLENVFLGRDDELYRSVRSTLSDRLQTALVDLEAHWKKIAESHLKRSSDS
jgi:hypothetical protein